MDSKFESEVQIQIWNCIIWICRIKSGSDPPDPDQIIRSVNPGVFVYKIAKENTGTDNSGVLYIWSCKRNTGIDGSSVFYIPSCKKQTPEQAIPRFYL